jgi:hypothetical protein
MIVMPGLDPGVGFGKGFDFFGSVAAGIAGQARQ